MTMVLSRATNLLAALASSTLAMVACSSSSSSDPPNTTPGTTASAGARAAALIASCLEGESVNYRVDALYAAVLFPIHKPELFRNTDLACLDKATNGCAALSDCSGITVQPTEPCADSCAGNVLTNCVDTLKYTVDCAKHGLVCRVGVGAVCASPPAEACDFQTFDSRCDGETRVTCFSEVKREDCGALGMTCKLTGPSTSPQCVGKGAACTSTSFGGDFYQAIACEGDKLRACVSGGEHVFDCKTLGSEFSCQSKDGTAFCGLAGECTPGVGKGTCNGGKLTVCNAGRLETVDCTALGFTGCAANTETAFCTPSPWAGAN